MKISYQWLSDYVKLDHSVAEIEEALTLIGFEVEGIESFGVPRLENVVVGEVLVRDQHPDADRLSVCSVKVSETEEPVGIVCGAQNYKVGDRVPVALPGAVLPGDFKIKKSKLRGVPSAGMMCSAKELNLGDDHSGLLILEDRPAIGTPINEIFPEPDTVFDVEVTPNRPDCLSVIGIARELAAWFREDLKYPEIEQAISDGDSSDHLLESIKVLDSEACPRYTAWSIRGVKMGESPDWMKQKLRAAGLRPINNVVDCTNFVLLETGQPLHAFDFAKIKGGRLEIRKARSGESITTLDEKKRNLSADDLVVADAERPLVIAGIMGSVDAEVDGSSVDIVLEVAAFESTATRATSRRLGLSTDSSYRFERGVDPRGIEFAAARCIDLILKTAGGQVGGAPQMAGTLLDTFSEIEVTPEQITKRIGFEVPEDDIAAAWERLEFEVSRPDDASEPWRVRVPSFRGDLGRVADLTEEFLRMYGTDRIPESSVGCETVSSLPEAPGDLASRAFRSHLVANGFNEAFNYTLVSGDSAQCWQGSAGRQALEMENPLSQDQSHLRPSLLSGLLDVIRFNRGRARKEFRFFECGRVFREEKGRVNECLSVAFAVCAAPEKTDWLAREPFDFFSARGLLEDLVGMAGLQWQAGRIRPAQNDAAWTEKRSAELVHPAGWSVSWGALSRSILEAHEISDPVFAGELIVNPARLDPSAKKKASFVAPSSFPRSIKDIAVVVPQSELAESVRSKVASFANKGAKGFTVESVNIFDVYEGKGLPEGHKSIAFSVEYGSPDRTLTEKEVGKAFDDLQKRIAEEKSMAMR
ncbi:phenylalanine--tRNA ligase subunit beta [Puniceicoccus vermicola]|uniref:Phenylalanine--tRNA ligase beta subunit n=1 Tax=Puniceicoccus vermicola TaxID=388746 RepID=A0A7X1E5U6_9BACT|nr:phenylalanine--tRNA ligase subunit beta [Puniceicoccus vermicola]MBC2601972.1 phenylalanine--tRNA ligase subunit beta [Puniceicoccus vermicola]